MKNLFILSAAVLLTACNENKTEVIELTLPFEPVQAIEVAEAIEEAKSVDTLEKFNNRVGMPSKASTNE